MYLEGDGWRPGDPAIDEVYDTGGFVTLGPFEVEPDVLLDIEAAETEDSTELLIPAVRLKD
jgi:hypothetical protein